MNFRKNVCHSKDASIETYIFLKGTNKVNFGEKNRKSELTFFWETIFVKKSLFTVLSDVWGYNTLIND